MTKKIVLIIIASILVATQKTLPTPPEGFNAGFGISPAKISIEILPGRTKSSTFKIANSGISRGKYVIEIADLGQNNFGDIIPTDEPFGARSCREWIDIPSNTEIPPLAKRVIDFNVYCPPDAEGSYYALIVVTIPERKTDSQFVVSVRPRLAIVIEVVIPKPAPSHLEVVDIRYYRNTNILGVTIKNTGVWKKAIEGDLLISQELGLFPLSIEIPKRRDQLPIEIYPGISLTLNVPLENRLKSRKYRIETRLRLTGTAESRQVFYLDLKGNENVFIGSKNVQDRYETDIKLEIDPEIIETFVPPGGNRMIPVKFYNNDIREISVKLKFVAVKMNNNGQFIFSESKESLKALSNFITINPDSFLISPKRIRISKVQVEIPRNVEINYPIMGALRISAEAETTMFSDGWLSRGEYFTVISITDPRVKPAEVVIENIELIRSSADQNPSVAIIKVKNTGQNVANLNGIIFLMRSTGQKIKSMSLGKDKTEILMPNNTREFHFPIGPLDEGEFVIRAELFTNNNRKNHVVKEVSFESLTSIPDILK